MSLRLAWTLQDPSPGNTTYTIFTYEGTDDIGTLYLLKELTTVYGMYQFIIQLFFLKLLVRYSFCLHIPLQICSYASTSSENNEQ